jgi:hypothetical protein
MKQHTALTFWTLVANFLIVIAAGHGGSPIGLLEVLVILNMAGMSAAPGEEGFFSSPLLVVGLLTMIGQVLVITAQLTKHKLSFLIKLIGISFLLAA